MPSTVAELLDAAGLVPGGVVRWGTPVPENGSGNYVVALSDDAQSLSGARESPPLDVGLLAHLLDVRPELRLDGKRPTVQQLEGRLRSFWLPNEVVLYAGLAGTSVRRRVGQYYKTPLGARRPHAGGWWLKTLTVLEGLWVHYAATADDAIAEVAMLRRFVEGLDEEGRAALHDPGSPAPFANLRTARGDNKKHGITGATGDLPADPSQAVKSQASHRRGAARGHSSSRTLRKPKIPAGGGGDVVSQNVTAADLGAGRVRFPRAAKRLFPQERAYVDVVLRDMAFDAIRWDPRTGPDKERSGLLSFGKGNLAGLVSIGDVLVVVVDADGKVHLR